MSSEDPTTSTSSQPTVSDDATVRERDELYDRLLRLTAEFDNYRKRVERERIERSAMAAADLIQELLPVVDDLERALSAPVDKTAGAAAAQTYRDGVALIHRQLLEVLRRRGLEPLDVLGHDFDPEWHEAVVSEPAGDHRDGEITAEIRRGYRLGDRLLRAAMVKVAKA